MNAIFIVGSSRKGGNTRKLIDAIKDGYQAEVIELIDLTISYYDYQNRNINDDFLPIVHKMLNADAIVLASPVYWYSASAVLKTFIDRFSDLVTIRKDLGKSLAGKKLFVVSCGSSSQIPESFETPYKGLASYMNMEFGGYIHGWIPKDGRLNDALLTEIVTFARKIFASEKQSTY